MKDFIYMKQSNHDIHSLKDLDGKTLAITKDNGRIFQIKKNFPNSLTKQAGKYENNP